MRVGEGAGEGRGLGTEGDPLLSRASGPSFQGNLTERGRGALGPCHWTLICPAKAGGCPRVNSFLSEELLD